MSMNIYMDICVQLYKFHIYIYYCATSSLQSNRKFYSINHTQALK